MASDAGCCTVGHWYMGPERPEGLLQILSDQWFSAWYDFASREVFGISGEVTHCGEGLGILLNIYSRAPPHNKVSSGSKCQ